MSRVSPLVAALKNSLMSWADDAACRSADGDAWFADYVDPRYHQAKTICHTCPVINQCLEHALTYEHEGIWGGLGAKERDELKRETRRGPIT
jgi:WhiB family redox-sensing transcriptional regulator